MENISFRLARDDEDDGSAFCQLYNSLYTNKVDLKYYRWQFFNTPFTSLLFVVIVNDTTLIGSYGVHLIPSNHRGVKIAWVIDLMLDPAYQDRGIVRNLGQFAKQQISEYRPAGLFGIANEKGADALVYGLGWEKVNVYSSYVACTDLNNPLATSKLTFQLVPSINDSLCKSISFLEGKSSNFFLANRDETYLHWRYSTNPRYEYDQFKVCKNDDAFGYLVLKSFTNPLTAEVFGDIVDIAWREDDEVGLTEMLRFALLHFKKQGVARAVIWLQTNTLLDYVGREFGFRQVDHMRFFCCEILDKNYDQLGKSKNWFLTLSDSEVY